MKNSIWYQILLKSWCDFPFLGEGRKQREISTIYILVTHSTGQIEWNVVEKPHQLHLHRLKIVCAMSAKDQKQMNKIKNVKVIVI